MKLRFRVDSKNWHIPQYQLEENSKWIDFKVKHLTKGSDLLDIAFSLGKRGEWSSNTWHYNPNKGESIDDMPLIFENELKVCAFLGAAKINFTERVKEVDL